MAFNVRTYGAVGNGVTNDAPAINAAIAAASVAGGEIFFPTGTYLITTSINVNRASLHLKGEGYDNTTIVVNMANNTTDGIVFQHPTTEINSCSISGMFIDVKRCRSAISVRNSYSFRAHNLKAWYTGANNKVSNFIELWRGTVAYNTALSDIMIGNNFANGVLIGNQGTGSIQNVELLSVYVGSCGRGVAVIQCGGFKWNMGEALNCDVGLLIESTSSANWIKGVQLDNIFFDTCTDDNMRVWVSNAGGSNGSITGISATNCSFNWQQNGTSGAGARLVNLATSQGRLGPATFVNCEFLINLGSGLYAEKVQGLDIIGCRFINNGTVAARKPNLKLNNNTTAKIIGGFFGNDPNDPSDQRSSYGIEINSSSPGNVSVVGAEFSGNFNGAFNPEAINNNWDKLKITDCIGFTTKNWGAAEITNGTDRWVLHGLSYTPNGDEVIITRAGNTTGAFYVASTNNESIQVRGPNGWFKWSVDRK